MNCPKCKHKIKDAAIQSEAAKINGGKMSEKKADASRKNGKKGGRPRKVNTPNQSEARSDDRF